MTYIFLSSQAVAYLSSVVMLISAPCEMGISSSFLVLPVRISGPFYRPHYDLNVTGSPGCSRCPRQWPMVVQLQVALPRGHYQSPIDGTNKTKNVSYCLECVSH